MGMNGGVAYTQQTLQAIRALIGGKVFQSHLRFLTGTIVICYKFAEIEQIFTFKIRLVLFTINQQLLYVIHIIRRFPCRDIPV